eukprot:TRINITY_DN8926_c0_g1_i2.p1 TRINITY_DN8926_c0_g1~~TRINITY_DN8926_c0_g1_i2.p1  ORF type:complete len:167 (-),score=16.16 TRINITY_DN8926_c0_g1_i2:55-555(-)
MSLESRLERPKPRERWRRLSLAENEEAAMEMRLSDSPLNEEASPNLPESRPRAGPAQATTVSAQGQLGGVPAGDRLPSLHKEETRCHGTASQRQDRASPELGEEKIAARGAKWTPSSNCRPPLVPPLKLDVLKTRSRKHRSRHPVGVKQVAVPSLCRSKQPTRTWN